MPITSDTQFKYAFVPRYEVYQDLHNCTQCVNVPEYTVVGYTIREDYEEEQREKQLPVFEHLTSRPSIRTIDCHYCKQWSPQTPCYGCKRKNYAYTTQVVQYWKEGWFPEGIDLSTGWETEARLKIEERQQNIAESLYEWRQTARMVVDAARLFRSGWRRWISGQARARRGRIVPSDIATAELTLSFGVNPLIMETREAYEALTNKVEGGLLQRFSVTASRSMSNHITPNSLFEGYYRQKRVDKAVFFVRYHEIVPHFTMGAPWELAWEVTPFSWLIDGFVDVGSYLNALNSMSGVAKLWGTLTTKTTQSATGYGKKYTTSVVETPERYKGQYYIRKTISDIPCPRMPRVVVTRNWRSLMHAVSALVVLRGSRR